MLRSRFSRSSDGWQQSIVKTPNSAFRFTIHDPKNRQSMRDIIEVHLAIDPMEGSIFAAAVFSDGPDVVRSILLVAPFVCGYVFFISSLPNATCPAFNPFQELRQLTCSDLPLFTSLPYWIWVQHQHNQASTLSASEVLPVQIPRPTISYWSLSSKNNTLADTAISERD